MSSTNTTTAPLASMHLDDTLGAAFIGLIVAAVLFGVTNVQTLIYYTSSARDPRYMKYTTISDFIVRLYYTRRVWIMSKQNRFLTLGPAIFAIVTFVSGIGFASTIFTYHSTLQFANISWVLYTSLSSGVAADISMAGSLCYFLAKNRTGFQSTDTKISILMAYIINTGLLTSLCAVFCFVTYTIMPDNYVFIGFYFSLSKLYFNSFLATLNARDRLRDGLSRHANGGGGPGAYQMPRIVSVGSPGASKHAASFGTINMGPSSPTREDFGFGDKDARALSVTVRTETAYHSDESEGKPGSFKSVLPL
ncbi:hypothetical protein EW145_g7026 [Phellinidium pouzarii]|uniref:DUF6534 domain-containing protein n=1 Tax=Phellinidium pouzarii TaxID=167371 RepID=A0A4S4KR70_9AGAM|nr:hypothetical protein EW145_g7026 [Phellinidium pouzarii]